MSKIKIIKIFSVSLFVLILLIIGIFYYKNRIDYGNGKEDLVITDGKIYTPGNYDYKSIVIDGGTVTIDSPDGGKGELFLRAKEKIVIKSGAEINLSKKGYGGLSSEKKESNAGLVFNLAGGGGSHGGLGGSGSCTKKDSTKVYGFNDNNESFGEGGGIGSETNKGTGGDGGGFIKLVAPEITIDGKVISNGGDGLETGGGGGGGKVVLLSGKINLNGSIEVNGGQGGTSLFQGAGGGGGGVVVSNVSLRGEGVFVDGGAGGKAKDYYSGCSGSNGDKGKILLGKKIINL